MGISLNFLQELVKVGVLKGGERIMDIGSSNLYHADIDGVKTFVKHFTGAVDSDSAFAAEMERGSFYDPVTGGTNGAWAGQLFEKSGFEYTSIDIADGYKTVCFNLNEDSIPENWYNAFDVVINCGTTEHIFNQLHAFRCIHEMTKPGGIMLHQVPVSGSTDHGFFIYTSRFFF